MRTGVAWTMAGQWAGYIVQVATTAVLARLVSPHDFGIFGEALTVTALATQLQSLGLSQAVVQRATLTHGQMSNLFWLNAGAGGIFALLVVAAAPLVARFYGDPALVAVTYVLAFSYLVSGVGVQHAALMARRLRFRSMALRTLGPRIAAGAAGVMAALLSARYWALVVQQMVLVSATVVFMWAAIDWRPSRPSRGTGVRPMLRFGAGVSVANLLNYVSSNADNILIGRFLGAAPLGLYARAYNLFLVPLRQLHGPLGNVVQPVLAAVVDQPATYRRLYRRTLSSIAIVGMPGVVVLAVLSRQIIVVLLGDRWIGAVAPFRWLAIAGFMQMVSRTFSWLFTTSDRPRALAIWASLTSPALVGCFVVGLRFGITGVAAAYALGQVALTAPGIWYSTRGTAVGVSDVLQAVWRPAVVALIVGVTTLGALSGLSGLSAAGQLAASGVVAIASWAATVALWPALQADVRAVVGRFRHVPRHAKNRRPASSGARRRARPGGQPPNAAPGGDPTRGEEGEAIA